MISFKLNYLHIFKLYDDFLKFGCTKINQISSILGANTFRLNWNEHMNIELQASNDILKFKNKTQNLGVKFGWNGSRNDVETIF